MDNFVNQHFIGEISELYNKLNIIVAKVDFWRYLVLYKYGGIYLDMDSSIDKPLNELICSNIKNNRYPNNILKMTGPIVYTEPINKIHKELFNNIINHQDIEIDTDITYRKNNISYRLYGIDFGSYFTFKHKLNHLLYNNKKHWRQEEKEKSLLI